MKASCWLQDTLYLFSFFSNKYLAHETHEKSTKGMLMDSKILYKEESYAVIGACFNVYKEKGNGFLEAVYQECLEIEFSFQEIPYETQKNLQLTYRDRVLKQTYKPDFLCYNKIIVEIKALSRIVDEHRAQILNYLNGAGFKLGILVNLGHHPKLEYERFVL